MSGSDYAGMSNSLTFPAGSTEGAMVCTFIPISSDTVQEGDENFIVTLTTDASLVLGNRVTNISIIEG